MDSLWWLWLILLPLAVLAGILVFAAWFARQVVDRIIGRKHRWIEEIMRTGEAPAVWTRPATRLDFRGRGASEKVKGRCLRRLDSLIVYTEGSPLMGDEETKEVVLQRLDEVYDEWAGRCPERFRSAESAVVVSPLRQ